MLQVLLGQLKQVPAAAQVNVDFSEARRGDISIVENLYNFKRTHATTGGSVKTGHLK